MFGLNQSVCPAIAAAAHRRRSRRSASLEVPQVEVANFAERRDVHLGVGSGRRCAATPQVVADLLEGKAISKKPRCAGMPQRMRSRVSGLDAKCDKLAIGNVVETAGFYRAPRCLESYENFRMRHWRADRIDVAGQRLGNGREERIDLRPKRNNRRT